MIKFCMKPLICNFFRISVFLIVQFLFCKTPAISSESNIDNYKCNILCMQLFAQDTVSGSRV